MPISSNAKVRTAVFVMAGIALFLLTASATAGYAPADTDGPGTNGKPGSTAVSPTPPSSNGSFTGAIAVGRSVIRTQAVNGAPGPARRALTGRTIPAVLLPEPHFWFERPFTSNNRQWAESTFPYGSNGDGAYVLHTGIDITNPLGTLVRAIAGGTVIYAGNDADIPFGPRPDFYGNLVVVHIDRPHGEKSLYALFGHLDRIHVSEGQQVRAGDILGTVGMTGIAIGPHLHLEVRQGDPGYTATRNPGLWLQALPGCGILAGVITDEAGRPVSGERLLVYRASRPYQVWHVVKSYLRDEAIQGDDALGENFLLADLPAGEYEVVAGRVGGVVRVPVKIEPGQLTFVELKVAGE